MTEPKRRQGQGGATPKLLCPKCGEYLKRNYTRELVEGKQQFVKSGWTCPNVSCDYIIKDFVELEEETEKDTEPEDKLKKLQAEFFKTHDQLNTLAEQINALEKADKGKDLLAYEEKDERP